MKRLLLGLLLIVTTCRVNAQDKTTESKLPSLAFVPPTVKLINVSLKEDAQINPEQIMNQVVQRVINDGKKKKWPFQMLPPIKISSVYKEVTGSDKEPTVAVRFNDLKALATRASCQYLVVFAVNELTSRYYSNFFGDRVTARAVLEVRVYDSDTNAYVYDVTYAAETDHPRELNKDVGLRREQDGAINKALTKALEPFAKGKRMVVTLPVANVLVTVQKVIKEGKAVILDLGKKSELSQGMILRSIESDCEIKITEILDNASIAEVLKGTPKDKEVFRPQESANPTPQPSPQKDKSDNSPAKNTPGQEKKRHKDPNPDAWLSPELPHLKGNTQKR
jgi:hypothetical protein